MENGFVKLWRKSFESRVFNNEGLWKTWTWCLMKASHKKRWVTLKTGKSFIEVEILPGQFVFGRNSAAKKLKMKPSTLWDRMNKLQNMRNIDIKTNKQYSIVTILKWVLYQAEENKPDSKANKQPTSNRLATDTNKNVKNVKNVKEEKKKIKKKKIFIPPSQSDVINYFLENGYPKELGIKVFKYYSTANWNDSRGNQVKNWKQKMIAVWFKDENKAKKDNHNGFKEKDYGKSTPEEDIAWMQK